MHDFEEELKGRFKDAASTEDVDADQLWAGIAQALPTSPEPPAKKQQNRWLWLGLLFLLLLVGFFFGRQAVSDPSLLAEDQTNTAVTKQQASTKTTDPQWKPPTVATNRSSEAIEQTLTQTTTNQPTAENNNQESEQTGQDHDQSGTLIDNSSTPTTRPIIEEEQANTSALSTESPSALPVAINQLSSTQDYPETNVLDEPTVETTDNTSELPARTVLTSVVLPLEQLAKKSLLPTTSALLPEFKTSTLPARQGASNRFQLGIFTGLQFWSEYYDQDADLGKTLSGAYSSQPGYSVSLEIGYQLKPHLEIRSGLEYLRAYTQFNLTQRWDTLMFRDNIPGSELINAEATRTVKHLNEQQLLSIPILLGTHTDRGKWRLGINAGVNLNFLLKQQGKSLNGQEEIIAYEQTSGTETPYTSFFWSAQLQPYAQYQLKGKKAIQLRPSLRWQAHGNSAFFGLKHRSVLSGLSIGVLF